MEISHCFAPLDIDDYRLCVSVLPLRTGSYVSKHRRGDFHATEGIKFNNLLQFQFTKQFILES